MKAKRPRYQPVTAESIADAKAAQARDREAVRVACKITFDADDRIHLNEQGASTVNADPDPALKGAPSHEQQF